MSQQRQDPAPRSFASDNWAGVHPQVLDAIAAANVDHAPAYGGDPWTARFGALARELFGASVEAFPVFNGTGANVLALQAALPRWGAVICAQTAHINTDETGAPEKTGGLKLLPVATPDGKLTPELVAKEAWGWGNEHRAEPLAVSISQTTEVGTCYTADEVAALADQAHAHGMLLHVDGSRLGNAAAHLGTSLAATTSEAGADLLSLGGTKNGLLGAEAVIVLRPGAAPGLPYLRKMNLQLGSKMRFASAQLIELYGGELWRESAAHANAMAARLAAGLEALAAGSGAGSALGAGSGSAWGAGATAPETAAATSVSSATDGVSFGSAATDVPNIALAYPVESNAVFAVLPPDAAERARTRFAFGPWPTGEHTYRLMCAFDTTEADVDELLALIAG